LKIQINTISYFDVNQKNGGAIFAKNMNTFLNNTEWFEAEVYCNHRKLSVKNKMEINSNETSFKEKIKKTIKESKNFELVIHFLRNDLNALFLVIRLYFRAKFDKDSIFLFHDHLSLFYFSLFFPIRNFKVVMVMHNDGSPAEMVSSGLKSKLKIRILNLITNYQIKTVVSDVNKIIFLCDFARNKFINLYHVKEENTAIIPNGINTEFNFTKTESPKIRFITVCTMNNRKGIDTFIECLPIINAKYENQIDFTLIGQGAFLPILHQLANQYTNLNIIGESDKVTEYLSNSDVFFLLSKNEGQPLSILEALRASLFILATNVGCNASMVTEKNGFLVDGSQISIIEGFIDVIENWDLLKSKSRNSIDLIKNSFSEEKMLNSYFKIFKDFFS
jgi:glycosyltransferase involved in cell wall biosynthesis